MQESAQEICKKILDVSTWSDFDGHGLMTGIERAEYEKRTDEIIGSRIRVRNSDETEHVEEVLDWEPNKKLVMKIYDFPATLSFIATHFIEEWNFEDLGENETLITRKFQLFPKSFLSRPLLGQLAGFFKTAVAKHLDEMAKDTGGDF